MIISTIVLLGAMLLGVPIAFSIALSALGYFLAVNANLLVLPQQFIGQLGNIPLIAIPFFILAGELMNCGGVTRRIFAFALACVGRVPGGLGHTNVVAGMIFAGMSGSAVADLASVGKIGMKAMRDSDYPDDLSIGVITTTATIGPIIPPSINMVIFGSIANVPIGLLFLGGVIPGVLTGLMLMLMFAFLFWRRKVKVKAAPDVSFWRALREGFWSLMTPVVLLGSMFSGVATPTEAAILATVYTLIVAGLIYRELTWRNVVEALISTTTLSGAIMLIIGFAAPLGYVISRSQVAGGLSDFLLGSLHDPTMIMLATAVLLLIVGCFMEVAAAIILLTPVLGVALIATGLDPVYIGVMMVYTLGIGLVTPPVGLCLYVGSQVSGISLEKVIVAVWPFLIPLVVTMILIILFPQTITWLPNLVYAN
ncbi:TRAP transporter large permease [Castellaniella sp. GW247-6E4]|uniref:TRAP transporter large permease n=1 Tax=Castellaniella sp. GW247-6E4 TaxID=3140380 RepID=UPI00331499D3